MKKILLTLAALMILGLPAAAFADTITFTAPTTAADASSGRPNQFDLDHHMAYTWRIDNVNLTGRTLTGATLRISRISNWDTNPNMLFIHLLDTARNAGVNSFQDASSSQSPVTDINDDFAGSRYLSNPLVAAGTGNTFLSAVSFTTTATDYVFNFSAAQLSILSQYFLNGNNIAFGLDPDCHFFNNGMTFTITTQPTTATPEPTTMALLGTGLAGLYYRRRRQQRKA